ncbi:MAG: sigma-70 family RNA polymerase sigma factor [Bacteroidetes bacterium]|nr:sigma-70 family RNA polymerase sigma factor [Bacteroidota bacterium]
MTNKAEKFDDIQVIERVVKGERALYEVLVRKYNPYLYKVGMSYGYNHDDTQDLMQDTYIDAFKSLSQFENKANFKTWLVRIMLNNCYRKKQKLSFQNEIAKDEIKEGATPMFEYQNHDTYSKVHNRELGYIIDKALHSIPEEYRMVFSLREMNQFNVAETAELLGLSEANVKVRLNRAKTMLKAHLLKSHNVQELYAFHAVYCDPFTEKLMKKINAL